MSNTHILILNADTLIVSTPEFIRKRQGELWVDVPKEKMEQVLRDEAASIVFPKVAYVEYPRLLAHVKVNGVNFDYDEFFTGLMANAKSGRVWVQYSRLGSNLLPNAGQYNRAQPTMAEGQVPQDIFVRTATFFRRLVNTGWVDCTDADLTAAKNLEYKLAQQNGPFKRQVILIEYENQEYYLVNGQRRHMTTMALNLFNAADKMQNPTYVTVSSGGAGTLNYPYNQPNIVFMPPNLYQPFPMPPAPVPNQFHGVNGTSPYVNQVPVHTGSEHIPHLSMPMDPPFKQVKETTKSADIRNVSEQRTRGGVVETASVNGVFCVKRSSMGWVPAWVDALGFIRTTPQGYQYVLIDGFWKSKNNKDTVEIEAVCLHPYPVIQRLFFPKLCTALGMELMDGGKYSVDRNGQLWLVGYYKTASPITPAPEPAQQEEQQPSGDSLDTLSSLNQQLVEQAAQANKQAVQINKLQDEVDQCNRSILASNAALNEMGEKVNILQKCLADEIAVRQGKGSKPDESTQAKYFPYTPSKLADYSFSDVKLKPTATTAPMADAVTQAIEKEKAVRADNAANELDGKDVFMNPSFSLAAHLSEALDDIVNDISETCQKSDTDSGYNQLFRQAKLLNNLSAALKGVHAAKMWWFKDSTLTNAVTGLLPMLSATTFAWCDYDIGHFVSRHRVLKDIFDHHEKIKKTWGDLSNSNARDFAGREWAVEAVTERINDEVAVHVTASCQRLNELRKNRQLLNKLEWCVWSQYVQLLTATGKVKNQVTPVIGSMRRYVDDYIDCGSVKIKDSDQEKTAQLIRKLTGLLCEVQTRQIPQLLQEYMQLVVDDKAPYNLRILNRLMSQQRRGMKIVKAFSGLTHDQWWSLRDQYKKSLETMDKHLTITWHQEPVSASQVLSGEITPRIAASTVMRECAKMLTKLADFYAAVNNPRMDMPYRDSSKLLASAVLCNEKAQSILENKMPVNRDELVAMAYAQLEKVDIAVSRLEHWLKYQEDYSEKMAEVLKSLQDTHRENILLSHYAKVNVFIEALRTGKVTELTSHADIAQVHGEMLIALAKRVEAAHEKKKVQAEQPPVKEAEPDPAPQSHDGETEASVNDHMLWAITAAKELCMTCVDDLVIPMSRARDTKNPMLRHPTISGETMVKQLMSIVLRLELRRIDLTIRHQDDLPKDYVSAVKSECLEALNQIQYTISDYVQALKAPGVVHDEELGLIWQFAASTEHDNLEKASLRMRYAGVVCSLQRLNNPDAPLKEGEGDAHDKMAAFDALIKEAQATRDQLKK